MLYWIIIGICLAEFAYTTLLFRLNNKSSHLPIPDVLVGIYTPAAYRRQHTSRTAYSSHSAVTAVYPQNNISI